jgi:light-regulated signal transduction histidine kinase (bacteriophytochrome)
MNHVVQDAVDDLEVPIRETAAHVEIGALPIVIGDATQLRQLFQNLIANAVKYRRPAATPVIRIYSVENKGTVTIFVEDNGIGFEEKYLGKIFQPFQRLYGRNDEHTGTGMGLAICRKIVQRHGGTITAKSMPGEGSTFLVTLISDKNRR